MASDSNSTFTMPPGQNLHWTWQSIPSIINSRLCGEGRRLRIQNWTSSDSDFTSQNTPTTKFTLNKTIFFLNFQWTSLGWGREGGSKLEIWLRMQSLHSKITPKKIYFEKYDIYLELSIRGILEGRGSSEVEICRICILHQTWFKVVFVSTFQHSSWCRI